MVFFFGMSEKTFFSLKNPFKFSFEQVRCYFLLFEFMFTAIFRLQKMLLSCSLIFCCLSHFFSFLSCLLPFFPFSFFSSNLADSCLLSLSPPLSPSPLFSLSTYLSLPIFLLSLLLSLCIFYPFDFLRIASLSFPLI